MKNIYNMLERVHRLQTACFNTPISIDVSTSKSSRCQMSSDAGRGEGKTILVTVMVDKDSKTYLMSSDMPNEDMAQKWGDLKQDVDLLLDELVGKRINANGRVKKPKQQ